MFLLKIGRRSHGNNGAVGMLNTVSEEVWNEMKQKMIFAAWNIAKQIHLHFCKVGKILDEALLIQAHISLDPNMKWNTLYFIRQMLQGC